MVMLTNIPKKRKNYNIILLESKLYNHDIKAKDIICSGNLGSAISVNFMQSSNL